MWEGFQVRRGGRAVGLAGVTVGARWGHFGCTTVRERESRENRDEGERERAKRGKWGERGERGAGFFRQ